MRLIDWQKELSRNGYRVTLSDLPVAMHCHHYNVNLHKTLEDALGEKGVELLYRAAEEASFIGLKSFLNHYRRIKTIKSRLELAEAIYQHCGLGILHFQKIGPRGGHVVSMSSHHVTGWLAKHGRRDSPGCHFSRGWIAGILEVVYNQNLQYYEVEESACKMMRHEACVFNVKARR